VLKVILAVLFFGPLIAPLFQATGLPLVADTGGLARDMLARFVCPTPAKSYMIAGFPMAVCARCWGATIGLWAAWLLLQATADDGRRTMTGRHSIVDRLPSIVYRVVKEYIRLAWPLRLLIGALPFLLWVAEIRWWPAAPLGALLLNGALAGLAAGLFFCSIWPGLRQIEPLRRLNDESLA
jgi:hypothetical protein